MKWRCLPWPLAVACWLDNQQGPHTEYLSWRCRLHHWCSLIHSAWAILSWPTYWKPRKSWRRVARDVKSMARIGCPRKGHRGS